MKKLLVLSLTSILTFSGLVACSDQPEQHNQAQIPQSQPQVVVVDNGSNDGLSTGEAMLVGAAAGAVAGHLTSNNSGYKSSTNNHYYTSSSPTRNPVRTTTLPPASSLKSVSNSYTTPTVKKPMSLNLSKPSSSSSYSSSSKSSFKSSGSGFKSSSSRRR